MRVKVAGPVKAKKGQTLRFDARLPEGLDSAMLEVFSSVGKMAPSPHVHAFKLASVVDGRPNLVQSAMIRMHRARGIERILEITADEDSKFYLYHDVDVKGDPLTKARITRNGSLTQRIIFAFRRIRGRQKR